MQSPYNFTHIAPLEKGKQPAIFLLHGLGSNEHDLLQLVGDLKSQCHIFSLRGPIEHSPGFAFYTFEEEGKPNREVFDKVVQFTRLFIVEAIKEYNLDEQKIYVVGFNQGAAIAQTLAVVMGQLIRGTIALSGFIPEFVAVEYNKLPMNNSKIFISHGEYDYVYPIVWGEGSAAFFTDFGADVTFKSYPDGHGVTPENLKDLVDFIAQDLTTTITN
ncbi:dienelactone hydrolase family protein [Solibacillus sp. CAU 1738]|uniref:alpha/beta hydrolase n=1 Tax=Solibacillus sp. CAU 1738 TaxID=3140363 RepID=UPI0032615D2F